MCTTHSVNVTTQIRLTRKRAVSNYYVRYTFGKKHKTHFEFNYPSIEIKRRTGVIIIVYIIIMYELDGYTLHGIWTAAGRACKA